MKHKIHNSKSNKNLKKMKNIIKNNFNTVKMNEKLLLKLFYHNLIDSDTFNYYNSANMHGGMSSLGNMMSSAYNNISSFSALTKKTDPTVFSPVPNTLTSSYTPSSQNNVLSSTAQNTTMTNVTADYKIDKNNLQKKYTELSNEIKSIKVNTENYNSNLGKLNTFGTELIQHIHETAKNYYGHSTQYIKFKNLLDKIAETDNELTDSFDGLVNNIVKNLHMTDDSALTFKNSFLKLKKGLFELQVKILFSKMHELQAIIDTDLPVVGDEFNKLLDIVNTKLELMNEYLDIKNDTSVYISGDNNIVDNFGINDYTNLNVISQNISKILLPIKNNELYKSKLVKNDNQDLLTSLFENVKDEHPETANSFTFKFNKFFVDQYININIKPKLKEKAIDKIIESITYEQLEVINNKLQSNIIKIKKVLEETTTTTSSSNKIFDNQTSNNQTSNNQILSNNSTTKITKSQLLDYYTNFKNENGKEICDNGPLSNMTLKSFIDKLDDETGNIIKHLIEKSYYNNYLENLPYNTIENMSNLTWNLLCDINISKYIIKNIIPSTYTTSNNTLTTNNSNISSNSTSTTKLTNMEVNQLKTMIQDKYIKNILTNKPDDQQIAIINNINYYDDELLDKDIMKETINSISVSFVNSAIKTNLSTIINNNNYTGVTFNNNIDSMYKNK